MISVQGDRRHHNHHQPLQLPGSAGTSRPLFSGDRVEPSSLSLLPLHGHASTEVDEEFHLSLTQQMYKAGNYKQALEHSKAVYERNPLRADNLLLMGAIYCQLHDFDMCIAKNEEALRIDSRFAECYGNMANAWKVSNHYSRGLTALTVKEKGNIDIAIQYYMVAIDLHPNFADAWSNLASAYMLKGRLTEAERCCRQALAINPLMVDAHSNLGNLMKAQGLVQEFNTDVKLLSSSQGSDDG